MVVQSSSEAHAVPKEAQAMSTSRPLHRKIDDDARRFGQGALVAIAVSAMLWLVIFSLIKY